MSSWRIRLAWALAIGVDALQLVAFPLFAPGAVSPFDDIVDVVLAGTMVALLGWHWAFAPSLLAELVPGLDLVPTWTGAVFIATRRLKARPAGQIVDAAAREEVAPSPLERERVDGSAD